MTVTSKAEHLISENLYRYIRKGNRNLDINTIKNMKIYSVPLKVLHPKGVVCST